MGLSDADLKAIDKITLLACGTSWHAALVGKFMIEELAKLPVEVDYGSEYRYRNPIINEKTLAVAITQSGETADTLAALREAKGKGARSLAICNVVGSMATREAQGTIHTHAGPEIGVASTKAFTTQLVALYLFALKLSEVRGTLSQKERCEHIAALMELPKVLEETLKVAKTMEEIAAKFHTRSDFLYLGRGINYPIALEGALKLKEISYIHAEGLSGGGDEARSDRAHRRADAGRRHRDARSRVRKNAGQHPGSQGARRLDHRDHDQGRHDAEGVADGRRQPCRSSCHESAVDAGRDLSAVAAFVVLHRRSSRL